MHQTSDKILRAALQLMQDKGYHAASTKEIAQLANVSEMTLFRHFKTKMGVLEAAIDKYSYIPSFEKLFIEQIQWDLVADLKMIAEAYLHSMNENKAIFLIAIQERNTLPELSQIIAKHTMKLNDLLVSYFQTMQDQQKIKKGSIESQAMILLTTLYGYFSSTALWQDHFLYDNKDSFLHYTIQLFSDGLCNRNEGSLKNE